MGLDRKGGREPREQFSSHIPHLVQQSILGQPDKARRAQRELISGLRADESYDPVLLAVEQI